MEDPDYVPDMDEMEEDHHRRTRRKHRHRKRSPSPVPDFDWETHYLEMKDKKKDPPHGIALPPLRIASFNIQVFGERKMKNKDVSGVLVKILQRYDVILVQEIRDSSDTALDKLVRLVSSVDPSDPYASIVSERLGRTNSKEQYAFLFRTSRISVRETYQYDDGKDNGSDIFQREPFAVRFYSPYTDVTDFGIIAIHTEPGHAAKEIDALVKVYDVTKQKWGLADIMIAGDFNADEGYVNRDDWAKIALRNDRRFKWMIDDETDTTVGNTDRAYDRFVVAGRRLTRGIVPGSTGVFKFDEALGLTPEEAEDVSDHYPIEIELIGTLNYDLQAQLSTDISFTIKQKEEIPMDKLVKKIYNTPPDVEHSAFFSHRLTYDSSGNIFSVIASRHGVTDVLDALHMFQKAFPGVLCDATVEMTRVYMDASFMNHRPKIYGLVSCDEHTCHLVNREKDEGKFNLEVEIRSQKPLLCSLTVTRPMS